MIEAVMLAALGFLVATLLWLLALPAISRRADRLARRRAELTFPLSLAEVAAERDHLRAAHAVREQALLRQVEDAQAARADAMMLVGQRDSRIADLARTVEAREARIADISATLETTAGSLADTQAKLAEEEASHARTRSDLAVALQSLAERDREIGELRVIRADLTAEGKQLSQALAQTRAALEASQTALSALRDEHAALTAAHEALSLEKDRLRITLAESETLSLGRASRIDELDGALKLATERAAVLADALASAEADARDQQGRLEMATARLAETIRQLDQLTAQHAALVTDHQQARARSEALVAERDDLAVRLREAGAARARLQAERDSARRTAEAQLAGLRSELEAAAAQAAAARSEKAALKREVAMLRRAAEAAQDRIALENAQLRREISRIADAMLAQSPQPAAAPITVPVVATVSPPAPANMPAAGDDTVKAAPLGKPRRRARLMPPPAAE